MQQDEVIHVLGFSCGWRRGENANKGIITQLLYLGRGKLHSGMALTAAPFSYVILEEDATF